MANNQELAEKIGKIKSEVTSYVYANMSEEFQKAMYSFEGSKATFTTENGLKVQFKSFRRLIERFVFVEITGTVMDKPFEFNFRSSMSDYGCGTIFSGNYGIEFRNVGNDEMKPTIKPFKKFLGRKSFHFADKAFSEILPLLEEFSRDIKTMQPTEETEPFLKRQEDVDNKDEITIISLAKEAPQPNVQIYQEQVACIAGTETFSEIVDGVEYEYELCECGNKMNYREKVPEHTHVYTETENVREIIDNDERERLKMIRDRLHYCYCMPYSSDFNPDINNDEVDTPSSGIKM